MRRSVWQRQIQQIHETKTWKGAIQATKAQQEQKNAQAAQIGARQRAENDPPIEIEHVGRAEEQRRGREKALERADLERAEEDQELADKPACPGQADRGQSE